MSGSSEVRNPFVGPESLDRGNKIYGRDDEIRDLFYLLTAERIVWLYSLSGAGKTSLVRAGLIPELEHDGFEVLPLIRVNTKSAAASGAEERGPSNRYVASTLACLEGKPVEELGDVTLDDYLRTRAEPPSANRPTVLVFDQFEEVLTADPLDGGVGGAKDEFFTQLGKALQNRHVWALFGLREDYLAALDPYVDRLPGGLSNRFRLELLKVKTAGRVVEQIVLDGSPRRELERAATDKLIADLATVRTQRLDGTVVDAPGPHVEPVQMQVACQRLWNNVQRTRPDSTTIDTGDLTEFGDVNEALGRYYAESVARIAKSGAGSPLARERAIRKWFDKELVTSDGIRSQVPRGAESSGSLDNDIVNELRRDSHLIRAVQRANATWYELTHDRLVTPVRESNQAWAAEQLHPMQRQAELWEEQGRPDTLLLRGRDLGQAVRWAKQPTSALEEPSETDFLAKSRALRNRRRGLRATAALVGFALVLGLVIVHSFYERANRSLSRSDVNDASRLAEEGQAEQALAYLARALRNDPQSISARSWASSLILYSQPRYPEASVTLTQPATMTTVGPDGQRMGIAFGRSLALWNGETVEAHDGIRPDGPVLAASIDPHGEQIATVSAPSGSDGVKVLQRWSLVESGPTGEPFEYRGSTLSAWFSPPSSPLWRCLIATASDVWIRDVAADRALGAPLAVDGRVVHAAFSHGGERILTISSSGHARVWDTATGSPIGAPFGHAAPIVSSAWSRDDSYIATGSYDNTARVWEVASGGVEELYDYPPYHNGPVHSLDWSPDGGTLLTGSFDKTARLWALTDASDEGEPLRHPAPVRVVRFSHDGRLIATSTWTGAVYVWDAMTGLQVGGPIHHSSALRSLEFSPESSRKLSTVAGANARRWDVAPVAAVALPLTHDAPLESAVFERNDRVISLSQRGQVVVWDVTTGRDIETYDHPNDPVLSPTGDRLASLSAVAVSIVGVDKRAIAELRSSEEVSLVRFSPDGEHAATVSGDGSTVQVWEVENARPLHELAADGIDDIALANGGRRIATVSNGTATVRDLRQSSEAALEISVQGRLDQLAWGTDGARLLIVSGRRVVLWDVEVGSAIGEPVEHDGPVTHASFARAGDRVMTVSERDVWIRDASTLRPLGAPLSHDSVVRIAAFSPDGRRVVTTPAVGQTARVWDVLLGSSVDDAERLAALSEAVGGFEIDEMTGSVAALEPDARQRRWDEVRSAAAGGPPVLAWQLEDPWRRTHSPLSKLGVDELLSRLLDGCELEPRQEAERAFPGHPRLAECER